MSRYFRMVAIVSIVGEVAMFLYLMIKIFQVDGADANDQVLLYLIGIIAILVLGTAWPLLLFSHAKMLDERDKAKENNKKEGE